jgi:hypothetical protein
VPLHPGLCNGGHGGGDDHHLSVQGGGGEVPYSTGYSAGELQPSNSYGPPATDSYGAPVAVPYGGGGGAVPSGPEAAYGDGLAPSVLLDGIAGYPLRPQEGSSGYSDSFGVNLQGEYCTNPHSRVAKKRANILE